MSWRMQGAALVAAALALLDPWQARADAAMDAKIEALVPDLEAYIAKGMADFHVPGVAIGIVSGDRLVWSKGFGVAWEGGPPVDAATVFQVGSTTKAFLATTLAIGVDRDKLAWDDRVVDLYPEFQLQDPWVTREFRVFDLLAQRSGLPPAVNDMLGFVGFDEAAMIRSLRHVEPATSFRSTFTYTNVTHMLAGRVLAQAMGAADWPTLVEAEILAPLGMTDTSLTAEAMEAAAKGTRGYVWTPDKPIEVPFIPELPLRLRRRRRHQLDGRRHGEMGAAAARRRQLRGQADRLGREPRRHQDPAHRPRAAGQPMRWAGCCSRRRTGRSPGTTAAPPATAPTSGRCSTRTSG